MVVGSSSGICSDSDDAGRRQSSQTWGREMTCFHTSGTVFARLSEDEAQLCELPLSHNASCHDSISYDLDVGVFWEDALFIFYRYCMSPKMLTTCLFQIPAFTFQCEVLCPKMYCSVKPLFLFHFMELGIWFQMIAPAHAYALYKHEKPRQL